jgi:pyridoxamine 5'-phosphate oxidase
MQPIEHLTQTLRTDYTHGTLTETEANANPIIQFEHWLEEAIKTDQPEPNAMALATVDADGQPSCRIVLLRGVNELGFNFFTNYESRKANALEATHRCALTFFWAGLERQIRIEGTVERLNAAESDAYFHSRPIGSRIGAWASPQSQVLPGGRPELERLLRVAEAEHGPNANMLRPPFWGGFRCVPHAIEFWQGRSSRLHDRLRYRRVDGAWVMERLAP